MCADERRRVSASAQRYVYFAVAGDMVKIGCSIQPLIRLTQIAEWVPFRVSLAATMPGSFAMESALHRMFADDWSHLEWFHASPALTRFIERVSAGLPVEIANNAVANSKRDEGIRLKKILTRRVGRAESRAHGTGQYPELRALRPAYAQDALDSYKSANVIGTPADAERILAGYIQHLDASRSSPVRAPTEADTTPSPDQSRAAA